MALIVEDGTGLTTADAYIAVSEADTYLANHGLTTWAAVSTANKEIAIRLATQALDAFFEAVWLGVRLRRLQSLDWPRLSVVDLDGYVVDAHSVPNPIKDATSELSSRSAAGTILIPDVDSGTIRSEQSKAGSVEEKIEYLGGKSQFKDYALIRRLIVGLIQSTTTVERA